MSFHKIIVLLRVSGLCLFVSLLLGVGELTLAKLPDAPILRLSTTQHMAAIRDIDSTESGSMIASVADDKTIKLWSTENGELIKTIRVPMDENEGGKLYAVNMHPQGKWVAAAGATLGDSRTDIGVYVIDTISGKILNRVPSMPQVVLGLCGSKQGRFLAATLGGKNGLRVFDAKNEFQLIFSDPNYQGNSYGCDFGSNGELVTASYDGNIRLYTPMDSSYKLKEVVQSKSAKRPFSVKFNHVGDRVAIGFADLPQVEVRKATDLSVAYEPNLEGLDNGSLSQVAWAKDDKRLYAAARYRDDDGMRQLVYWDQSGRSPAKKWSVASESILTIESIDGGKIVTGTAAKNLLFFDKKGRKLVEQISSSTDMRGKLGRRFMVSNDGATVSFSLGLEDSRMVSFHSAQRRLESSLSKATKPPRTTSDKASLDNWLNSRSPTLNDSPIVLERHDVSRSLAFDKNDQNFLLGTEHSLKFFKISGALNWQTDVPAAAWGVNISENNKLAVVAYGDGTIRWHRLSDGQLLLSLFIYNEAKDWILWTQSGYYDASPGSDRLIGWHKNNGVNQAPDFFSVNQLRHRFYRPEIVSKVLPMLDEAEAIGDVVEVADLPETQAKPIEQSLPPVVSILSPSNGSRFDNAEITLRYKVASELVDGDTKVSILVNGRPLKRDRGATRGKVSEQVFEKKITIPERDLSLSVVVENKNGVSSPSSVRLRWNGKKEYAEGRPKLFVLAAGVSDYQHPDIPDLEYAHKDAVDFNEVISTQTEKGLYQDVVVKVLENPSSDDIRQGLSWLKSKVTRDDVAMFYIAGHGLNDDKKRYFFITNETNPHKLDESALSYKDIRETLINLPSKTIAFVDTCQSGNALGNDILANDLNGVVNDLSATENGVIVFTSSTSSQPSLELTSIKNGVFTHSIIEGLRDGGSIDRYFTKDGQLTFKELDLHISNSVRKLTKNKQNPTLVTPNDAADYVIANVQIPLPE